MEIALFFVQQAEPGLLCDGLSGIFAEIKRCS